MEELFGKKVKHAKIFRKVLIGLLIAWLALTVIVGLITGKTEGFPPLLFLPLSIYMLDIVLFIVYLIKYHRIMKEYKALKSSADAGIVDDIDFSAPPTYPKSRLYCGEKAFAKKDPPDIIKYCDVAWIYTIEEAMAGEEYLARVAASTVGENRIIFATVDGKWHKIDGSDPDELADLVAERIHPVRPDLTIGVNYPTGGINYMNLVREYKNKNGKV